MSRALSILACCLAFACAMPARAAQPVENIYFAIQVVDRDTGRGIPMVQLETVNRISFWTDSGGWALVNEPDLVGRDVYFTVHAPGYEAQKDSFGYPGVAFDVKVGGSRTITLKRLNIAERLYRVTGTGIYRDTVLLGKKAPIADPLMNGMVAGQDSVNAALYRGHIFWFWGDTVRLRHPLGQYWTAGAISTPPGGGGLDPSEGVDLTYLVNDDGFARPMWPRPETGIFWTDGVMLLTGKDGREQLAAHYSHMKSLTDIIAHGIGLFDERSDQFSIAAELPKDDRWRCPNGQPTPGRGPSAGYYLFPGPEVGVSPFPCIRCKANLADLEHAENYEAYTCYRAGTEELERDKAGKLAYAWKANTHPVSVKHERELIAAGKMTEEEALYQVRDLETGKLIDLRAGSVNWNPYRKKWIMIGEQFGAAGFSGDIWYAEADQAEGPWRKIRRVATHGALSLYNPVHHAFFDQEGGRIIYFEGTLADTGQPSVRAVPRYEYNQLMYRLDLSDSRLWSEAKPEELEPKPK